MTDRQEMPPVQAGDLAPDAVLRDEDGNEIALSAFWQRQPTVLVFVRHYG